MSQETLCEQIENGMKSLLRNGTEIAKAGEIAKHGGVRNPTREEARTFGYYLGFRACDFDDVGYEVMRNDDDSNDYRFWWK